MRIWREGGKEKGKGRRKGDRDEVVREGDRV